MGVFSSSGVYTGYIIDDGEDTVIDGLRKAEAYDKHSISYIESVLLNEAKSFKEDN